MLKPMLLAGCLLASINSAHAGEVLDLNCTPVFEQPVERHDPVYAVSVTLWTDPQNIRVIHHAKSGDYSRGDQYLALLSKVSPLDWHWNGVFAKNNKLSMKGRLFFSEGRWRYHEMLFVTDKKGNLQPNYRMESVCQ